jgi:hypothetical protein
MKQFTIALFDSREDAEKAIGIMTDEHDIKAGDISYAYRNTEGEVKEVDAKEIDGESVAEGAGDGAMVGGTIGALAGLVTAAGVIPVIGPLFVAGPLVAALGLGAGAVGTTAAGGLTGAAAGGLTGAAAGGLIGALSAWGVDATKAKEYEDKVGAGNVLLTVHADESINLIPVLSNCGATDVNVYSVV